MDLSASASVPVRVCAVHDLSGYGRASLTVAIPVLSTMGFQVCPLPTAVLSSQTSGMKDFTFCDLTEELDPFLDHWERLHLRFSAVYSGFLGNPKQIAATERCISHFLQEDGFAFVDPVLGDNGVLDPTQTPEMVSAQRHLVTLADVIAPNLTEAAFLLDTPFDPRITHPQLREELRALSDMGPGIVIITSAPALTPDMCAVAAYDREKDQFWYVENRLVPVFYPGTGDTFSSTLVGAFLQGDSLPEALVRAVEFVSSGIELSHSRHVPPCDGVLLEQTLPYLRRKEPAGLSVRPF